MRSLPPLRPALAAVLTLTWPLAATPAVTVQRLASAGTTSLGALPPGLDAIQLPELGPDLDAGDAVGAGGAARHRGLVNRSWADGLGGVGDLAAAARTGPASEVQVSFDGLDHRDTRLANRGNQFSLEPPDQGLCVGNGFVLETVNSALRVFDATGAPLSGPVDLNTFYGYPAAIDRVRHLFGPDVFDPSCLFDPGTGRFFHLAATLEIDPVTGAILGPNHLDLAVSDGPSPLGTWTIYRLPTQDDGTQGTPDHGCSLNPDGTGHGPCFGDYPHLGADASALVLTTNEFSLFGPEFHGANVYALSKRALAAAAATLDVVQLETLGAAGGNPGFTLWPAAAQPGAALRTDGGTEVLLSSDAVFNASGKSRQIFLWRLRHTGTIDATPTLTLDATAVPVNRYAVPPKAAQQAGPHPLGECIDDTTTATPAGVGCWRLFFSTEPAHDEVESILDANDSRMQQTVLAGGLVWGALDTAVRVGGAQRAGVAWFAVDPAGAVAVRQGTIALGDQNLTYPAIAVSGGGAAVVAFTAVGPALFPSAAYATIGDDDAAEVHLVAAGAGPADGFTSYKAFVGSPPRTRWGDYGAAAMDGGRVWIASEYIAQTCTLAQYLTAPIGSCGATRTSLGNWATRISAIQP
ncbi:MAG TPA: hypothetical protein VFP50_08230 [Anaeromyxobacteraceae bacterium]|nr:hypothetical protein [Anaeromyxobacteraceae bacterium]